jgi:hypothetical protein
MTSATQPDLDKLKAAIKHIISMCSEDELGMVKMHKSLFYSDMVWYAFTGRSITGCEYRKRPNGPTCDSALRALRQLQEAGEIAIKNVDYFGFTKKAFSLLGNPDTNALSSDEKTFIADCTAFVCKNNTAKTISEFSHSGPWELVGFGEVIPYYASLSLVPTDVSDETMEWAEGAALDVEAARRDQSSVVLEDYRASRSRLLEARSEQ